MKNDTCSSCSGASNLSSGMITSNKSVFKNGTVMGNVVTAGSSMSASARLTPRYNMFAPKGK